MCWLLVVVVVAAALAVVVIGCYWLLLAVGWWLLLLLLLLMLLVVVVVVVDVVVVDVVVVDHSKVVVEACDKSGRWKQSIELLEVMSRSKILPTVRLYDHVLFSCGHAISGPNRAI